MAKIKAYTDEEQSRKLAKILPPESADMHYKVNRYNDKSEVYLMPYSKLGYYKDNDFEYCVPCWSLAALLEIIPVTIKRADNICRLRIDKSEKDFDIWYEEVDSGLAQLDLDIITPNIVDACVEMIEKLHNEKLTL